MSRRHAAEKREILPDAKYGDRVVSKFMNNLMVDGKKSVAETIVYNAFERVQTRLRREPVEVFHEALDNVKPSVEVRSRRVGGATYQVPVEVRPERREALLLVGAGGFSYEEAAEICGCAVGTIKSRVGRARAALTTMLDEGSMPKRSIDDAGAHRAILEELDKVAAGDGVSEPTR